MDGQAKPCKAVRVRSRSGHRDRDGTFEPIVIAKHQRRVPGFDEKILALYAKGMTTRDIQELFASSMASKSRPR